MSKIEPPDPVDLLRLIWCPDDVVDRVVLPTAFEKNDLKGLARRLSVDRFDQVVPSAIRETEASQKKKADPDKGLIREVSYGVFLNCGALRAYDDGANCRPFQVEPDPIIPTNPAHCAIGNSSGKKGTAYLLKLQTDLAILASGIDLMDTILAPFASDPMAL